MNLVGQVVYPDGVVAGRISFGSHIEGLESSTGDGPYILPGFIDTHVHGGGDGDTMDGAEGVRRLARTHLRHGTTTLYPTTITAPREQVLAALRGVAEVRSAAEPDLADIPGAHLEGPFISPDRLGAQPPHTAIPEQDYLEEILALNVVGIVTLAPERPGALEAALALTGAGVRVSIGHSRASYEQVMYLLSAVHARKSEAVAGVTGFTHLYNAMGGLRGREPGIVGAALASSRSYAELIYDKHHVHEGSFKAAYAAKRARLHLVSDAMRAAGTELTRSSLGGQAVYIKGGAARLADGTLAGSVLTLDLALRNSLEAGFELEVASRLLSLNPARYLGLDDRGLIGIGKRADLVVMNRNFEIEEVYSAGRKVVG